MKWSTFLKWAVPIGAVAAAPFTLGGSLLGLGAGGAGAGLGAGLTSLGAGLTTVGGTAAATGGLMSGATLLGLGGLGTNLATGLYGAHTQASAAQRAAASQIAAAKYAADREAEAQATQLKFLQDQEAARRKDALDTQNLNLKEYNQQGATDMEMFNRRQARLTPYRNVGEAGAMTMAQLMGLDPRVINRAYVPQPFVPVTGLTA